MTYTDEDFIAAMRKAVAERGEDFVYPDEWRKASEDGESCMYVHEGKPACLIGLAVYIATGELVPDAYEGAMADEVIGDRMPGVSDRARKAAFEAQATQDDGFTWGEALREFEMLLLYGVGCLCGCRETEEEK